MAFRVGQKVVCVDGRDNKSWAGCRPVHVVEGAIYTIRACRMFTFLSGPELGVWLHEIENPIFEWEGSRETCEAPFGAIRFRPVVEKSTDPGMAILREILDRETIKDGNPVRVS